MIVHPLQADANPLRNAHTLAVVTHATLGENPFEAHPVLRDLFTDISTFEQEAHWGSVISNDRCAVLAFRGTDSNLEWAETLTYRQIPWIMGKAHAGFVRALELLWEHVLAAMYDARVLEEDKDFWVTGHSLGGALALLAADRLSHLGISATEAVVFGTPPIFDAVAASAYRVKVSRFSNNEDPIPQLTWPTPFDSYAQVGEEIFLTASGAVGANRYSRDLARKIDRAMSIGEGILPAGMIHDHFMRQYLNKLAVLSERAASVSQ